MCFWDRAHESLPKGNGAAPSGVVLASVDVDVDAVERRLRAAGVPVVQPLRNEPWGQRHNGLEPQPVQ